jgi:2-C-methyl-D-erythritol 4-phosphate cytidylyltransferase/2-C-methyl-D-erythritol 2,4-cyclodiphosphate synthase
VDEGEPTGAILVAAGRGRRMGAVAKLFLPLGGRTVLERALHALTLPAEVHVAVVVAPHDQVAEAGRLAAAFPKVTAVVPGGEERQDSVAAGLDALPSVAWVVVHDAARPLLTPALVRRVLHAARPSGAATAAIAARDTVKVASAGVVRQTLDRDTIWLTQTPQAFRAALLREAHDRARRDGVRATDDAALVETMGVAVRIVEGEVLNLKVTTPEDLAIAEAVVRRWEGAEDRRTGIGYDVHRLMAGRRLVLGGIEIPYERGLAGHSDADVILHAIMDALLGAAGLPDIGQHFPSEDIRYRDADSRTLLREVVARLHQAGYTPAQVDVVILAEAPRLAPYLPGMRRVIAEVLTIEERAVGLKATTTEGLGAIGRGEGIAAQAIVTVIRQR